MTTSQKITQILSSRENKDLTATHAAANNVIDQMKSYGLWRTPEYTLPSVEAMQRLKYNELVSKSR